MISKVAVVVVLLVGFLGCVPTTTEPRRVPAVEYAAGVRKGAYGASTTQAFRSTEQTVTLVAHEEPRARAGLTAARLEDGSVTNMGEEIPAEDYSVYESSMPNKRDYNGPLSLGDPGLSASLWKESRGGNDLYRDYRAWQSMDLITIVISENSEGTKEADTDITQESTFSAAIESLIGLEDTITKKNPQVNLDNLVQASTSSDFKGEGETTRKGSLKAKISAMVAEVLPTGVLRIEGEKIIAVNSEDEVMVISGLVRPEDVNSQNEVDSSKIANMRIDYYGKGTVGDAQHGGWLGRIMRRLWPF